jgi:hypothetical protein
LAQAFSWTYIGGAAIMVVSVGCALILKEIPLRSTPAQAAPVGEI